MTIEPNTHNKIICFIFDEIRQRKIRQKEVWMKAGVNRSTLSRWKSKSPPNLPDIEAVLGALGYELEISRIKE